MPHTTTVTFTQGVSEDQFITITSRDGTVRTYVAKVDASTSDLHFAVAGGNIIDAAAGLKTAIESAGGHNGKIQVTQANGVLTLYQTIGGTAAVAINVTDLTGVDAVEWSGGTDYSGTDPTGLTIVDFASGQGPNNGCLAAVWYLKQASEIRLSGTAHTGIKNITSGIVHDSSMLSASVGALYQKSSNNTWNVLLDGTKYEFDFNRTSNKFIRKVFNTNPTKVNSTITKAAGRKNYWLGETYEGAVKRAITGSSANYANVVGFIAALNGGNSYPHADRRFGQLPSRTGWIISQDPRTNYTNFDAADTSYITKLFRFESLDDGEWVQNNVKVSIQDVKAPRNQFEKYGSFSVVLRQIDDTDNAPVAMERYSDCNLNPDSENYIARRIGDKYLRWNNLERKYQEEGNHDNISKLVRVVMNEDIDANGPDPLELVPFGSWGPLRYKGFTFVSGSEMNEAGAGNQNFSNQPVLWSSGFGSSAGSGLMLDTSKTNVPYRHARSAAQNDTQALSATKANFTGSWDFPSIPLRAHATASNPTSNTDSYFGADLTQLQESGGSNIFNEDVKDILRPLHAAGAGSSTPWDATTYTEPMWFFTLDDLTGSAGTVGTEYKVATYVSGSRQRGVSYTATNDSRISTTGYTAVLDLGYDRFTTLFYGGHSGYDITEREPFRNARVAEQARVEADNYAFYSVKKAIDSVADADAVEMDLLVVPGIHDSGVTDHMINVCENRSDALAVIDLPNDYTTKHESTSTVQNRLGTVDTAVSDLKARGINSSYACAFYPWVQVRDTASDSGAGQLVWVPPSVAALGTFGNTQRFSELWFAPAGFNRGGLSVGSSGLNVVNVRQKLTAKERDKLYENNINPIASFPSEGIVIFGQKTLQVTRSALDRINVRRLLIYLKKQISRLSTQVLFEPNVEATWDRFSSLVTPFLGSIQSRFGLQDYKLILDKTTTTDDLVDQNVMYAKIFLKPTRAIEFIALDFIITNTGASFEDL